MQIEPGSARAMIDTLRAEGARGPWLTLLEAVLRLAGPQARFLCHAEKTWASITFSGSRHKISLAFEGDEAIASGETFIAALPDHEFSLHGQLVADATITAVKHVMANAQVLTVEAELLVLDDA